jgi:hypothetical protein
MIMEQYGPGKTISFRLPHDTPEHVYKYLNRRKKKLGRKFSSEIAPLFVEAIAQRALDHDGSEKLEIPIPKNLTEEQKEWLTHPNTRALIGQLLYQVAKKPLSPIDLDEKLGEQAHQKKQETPTTNFATNKQISNFAKKTFLNFDDDDED